MPSWLSPLVSDELLKYVLQAGFVAKAVLLVLFVFSTLSWAIILEKYLLFRRIRRESESFLGHLNDASGKLLLKTGASFRKTPLARLSLMGTKEWESYRKESLGNPGPTLLRTESLPGVLENISAALERTASEEIEFLEKHLTFLATVTVSSPFLGLLGTVWGIMKAFMAIHGSGSAQIAVVAPGIAEALITTAVGLLVAIPALIGYNHYTQRIRAMSLEMDRFSSRLLSEMRKEALL